MADDMYRNKFRPKKWEQFLGNEGVIKSVKKDLGKIQSYLLHGERGTGKTTLARLICKYNDIDDMDIHEIDAASNTGVDDARRIKNEAYYLPSNSSKKAYILDEAHRLTGNASDALLKVFEEPPAHVIFIFCTTEINKISKTIRSRAYEYQLKPLPTVDILTLLKYVCKKENLKIKKEVVKEIVKASEGIARNALKILQTITGLKSKEALRLIKGNLISEDEEIISICRELIKGGSFTSLQPKLKALSQQKENPESIRKIMLAYMNSVLLGAKNIKSAQRAAYIIECFLEPTYDTDFPGITYAVFLACKGRF